VCLIGHSAYPLLQWLLKPFPDNQLLTEEKKHFNYKLSRARIVVENAFGRLKPRWRRLMKKNDMHIRNAQYVIAASCVLHNICEVHGDSIDDDWVNSNNDAELEQPDGSHFIRSTTNRPAAIRDALVRYFSQ
jgi:hypothetical protein